MFEEVCLIVVVLGALGAALGAHGFIATWAAWALLLPLLGLGVLFSAAALACPFLLLFGRRGEE